MVDDKSKTKAQLTTELEEMRQQQTVEKAAQSIRESVLAMRSSDDLLQVVGENSREVMLKFCRISSRSFARWSVREARKRKARDWDWRLPGNRSNCWEGR